MDGGRMDSIDYSLTRHPTADAADGWTTVIMTGYNGGVWHGSGAAVDVVLFPSPNQSIVKGSLHRVKYFTDSLGTNSVLEMSPVIAQNMDFQLSDDSSSTGNIWCTAHIVGRGGRYWRVVNEILGMARLPVDAMSQSMRIGDELRTLYARGAPKDDGLRWTVVDTTISPRRDGQPEASISYTNEINEAADLTLATSDNNSRSVMDIPLVPIVRSSVTGRSVDSSSRMSSRWLGAEKKEESQWFEGVVTNLFNPCKPLITFKLGSAAYTGNAKLSLGDIVNMRVVPVKNDGCFHVVELDEEKRTRKDLVVESRNQYQCSVYCTAKVVDRRKGYFLLDTPIIGLAVFLFRDAPHKMEVGDVRRVKMLRRKDMKHYPSFWVVTAVVGDTPRVSSIVPRRESDTVDHKGISRSSSRDTLLSTFNLHQPEHTANRRISMHESKLRNMDSERRQDEPGRIDNIVSEPIDNNVQLATLQEKESVTTAGCSNIQHSVHSKISDKNEKKDRRVLDIMNKFMNNLEVRNNFLGMEINAERIIQILENDRLKTLKM